MQKLGARDLRQILAVAEHGSIRRAANMLGMTQPGLSKNIRQIEERLGVPLFSRSTAGVRPTLAGSQLTERGRQILLDLESIEHDLVQLGRGEEGAVAIGLGPLMAFMIGPQIAAEVAQHHPGISLSVEVTHPGDFVAKVQAGVLDFSCGHIEDEDIPPTLAARQIYQHELVYFVREGHPLTQKDEVRLADLRGYQFAGTTVYGRFMKWFLRETGAKAEDFQLVCGNYELLAEAVSRTDYVSGCAPAVLTKLQQRHPLVPIQIIDGTFYHYVYCLVPRARSMSMAARRVLDLVEQILDGPAQTMDSAFCAPHFERDGAGY